MHCRDAGGAHREGGQISYLARHWLEDAIALLEHEIQKQLKPQPEYQLLITVPGIGPALGSAIALETGDIKRFLGPGHYASYARCVKSERISNGKRKGQGNTRNGNQYLAWAFMEAAHYAAIWSPAIKRYYQRKQARSHILVAKKAVANKLARACGHMLSRQVPFDVNRAFG
jgi:transposase